MIFRWNFVLLADLVTSDKSGLLARTWRIWDTNAKTLISILRRECSVFVELQRNHSLVAASSKLYSYHRSGSSIASMLLYVEKSSLFTTTFTPRKHTKLGMACNGPPTVCSRVAVNRLPPSVLFAIQPFAT